MLLWDLFSPNQDLWNSTRMVTLMSRASTCLEVESFYYRHLPRATYPRHNTVVILHTLISREEITLQIEVTQEILSLREAGSMKWVPSAQRDLQLRESIQKGPPWWVSTRRLKRQLVFRMIKVQKCPKLFVIDRRFTRLTHKSTYNRTLNK